MDQGPQRGPYIRHPSIIIVIPGVYTRFLPSFLPSFLSFFLSWLPSPLPSPLLARRFRKKARHVSTDAHLSLPTCLFRRENKRERKRESKVVMAGRNFFPFFGIWKFSSIFL